MVNKFPAADQIYVLRNKLILALGEVNISPAEIMRMNLSSISRGALLRIDALDGASFITLAGDAKNLLNGWQMLRPRGNPKGDALFIALRGKLAGQRLSVKSIRAIISKTGNAQAQKTRRKEQFQVIQGGRR